MFRCVLILWAALAIALSVSTPGVTQEDQGAKPPLTREQVEALEKKARDGDPDAQWNLGFLYIDVFFRTQNPEALQRGVELVKAAAEQDNAQAANMLGVLYIQGIGVEKSEENAEKWFARSAELGEPVGMVNYALLLLGRGGDENVAKARKLMESASEKDLDLAAYYLGRMELSGIGGQANAKRGVALLEKAAAGGMLDAMYDLARIYEQGGPVERNPERALAFLKAAATRNHAEAQWSLGLRYVAGNGVEKDSKEAVKWFRLSAQNGSPNGMASLGVMYATGDGVEKDLARAFQLYQKAADLGSAHAMTNLAYMYMVGEHVEKDLVEAKKWLDIAAQLGNERANSLRVALAMELTQEQLTEAERRKEAWLKEHGKQ